MLSPLRILDETDQAITFACVHWKHWPPIEATSAVSVEELRREGRITESQYAQFKVWKRVCGLTEMDAEKCLECPHVRKAEVRDHLPCLVTLDGNLVSPLADRENERLARGHLITLSRSHG